MKILFDIFRDFEKLKIHKKSQIIKNIDQKNIGFRTNQASSGFLITLPTRPSSVYQVVVGGELISGSSVFLHLESGFNKTRIVDRKMTSFKEHRTKYEFVIQFEAKDSLIDFGLLSWSNESNTFLQISKCLAVEVNHENFEESNENNEDLNENFEEFNENFEELNENFEELNEKNEELNENNEDREELNENFEELNENNEELNNENREELNENNEDEGISVDSVVGSDLGEHDLPELLPSQFIIPSDLYQDDDFNTFDSTKNDLIFFETNIEENKKIKNTLTNKNKENKNEKIKNEKNKNTLTNKNKEIKNGEIKNGEEFLKNKENEKFEIVRDEDDLYDSGRPIDLDEDIRLVDLGFDKIKL